MSMPPIPRERIAYSAIVDRPPLQLPGDAHVIVWSIVNLEVWDISRAMARQVIPAPTGQVLLPDVPNWSWHEYGMRVGFWRLRRVLEQLKMTPTITINARVCEVYPQVVQACLDSGWEINAHSYEQIPMHKIDDQRAVIAKTMNVIEKFTRRRPRGWFGPGLTETLDTIDHLAEAGLEYIGDWVLDDEPVTLKTRHKPIVALPYSFELHDIVMMSLQGHPAAEFHRRVRDHFDWLYAESAERPKIMAVAVHPYLSGVAHRIGYVERAHFDGYVDGYRDGLAANPNRRPA